MVEAPQSPPPQHRGITRGLATSAPVASVPDFLPPPSRRAQPGSGQGGGENSGVVQTDQGGRLPPGRGIKRSCVGRPAFSRDPRPPTNPRATGLGPTPQPHHGPPDRAMNRAVEVFVPQLARELVEQGSPDQGPAQDRFLGIQVLRRQVPQQSILQRSRPTLGPCRLLLP